MWKYIQIYKIYTKYYNKYQPAGPAGPARSGGARRPTRSGTPGTRDLAGNLPSSNGIAIPREFSKKAK